MSVKIIYKDFALGADRDATMSASGQMSGSAIALLPFGDNNQTNYTTLEHNIWALNGKKKIYDDRSFAFWSDQLSGADGYFSEPPEITAQMENQYNSLGIYLDFGEINACSEVELIWYQGEEMLSQMTFYPTSAQYFCENRVEAYNKVTLRLLRTAHPLRRARLNGFYFGVTRVFRRDELRSVRATQQIDLISKTIPENVLDWRLNSAKTVDYLFQRKQPVEAYDGSTFIGAFYIKNSSRKSVRVYDISCTDAVGVLDEEQFPDAAYTEKNALELAQEICSGFTVEMEEALQSKAVTGLLSKKTKRQALQQLCFAIGAVADTAGTDGIKIFVPPSSNAEKIPESRVRVGGSLKKSDLVTAVKLTEHNYSTSGSGAYTEVDGVKYYDTMTVHVLENPDATTADKQNVISITDATLISSANVAEILQRVFDFYMLRNIHNVSFRLEGEQMGDYITTPTNWGDMVTGNLTRATIVLSGIAVAAAEVTGT